MSYLESIKDAKEGASTHLWWNIAIMIFHLGLGGIMGYILADNTIQGNIQWWVALLTFFGIVFVEQFLMRNIELLIFGRT